MQEPGNEQLYALLNNPGLEASLRQRVEAMWEQRQIGGEEEQELARRYAASLPKGGPLKISYFILAILSPLAGAFLLGHGSFLAATAFLAQAIIAARLAQSRQRWRQYQWAVCISFLLGFIVLELTAVFYILSS